jgi:hypothetical protein
MSMGGGKSEKRRVEEKKGMRWKGGRRARWGKVRCGVVGRDIERDGKRVAEGREEGVRRAGDRWKIADEEKKRESQSR